MKKYLLILSSILFFFFSFKEANAQDIVTNGGSTKPINFPGGPCVYTWTNNNTSIGLAATGTGNIASFTAVNTGSSPVTATITATALPSPGFAYITNVSNNTLSVINLSTGVTVAAISVGTFPGAVTISPDGTRVYVANISSNSVSIISTATNTLIATVPLASSPAFMAISPDGSRIYLTNQSPATVSVISTVTNSVISTIPIEGSSPLGILVSPDGSNAYVTAASGSIFVINTLTNSITTSISVGADPIDFAQSPDGKLLYVSNFMDGTISVINTLTNVVVSTIPCGSNPYGITISHDGSKLYVANATPGNSSSGSITVINTASNAVENTISIGFQPYGIDLSLDDGSLYVEPTNGANMLVINTLSNAITANIPVYNPFSFGHFISSGCSGTTVTATIKVNPAGALPPTITATTATGAISACAGTASVSPQIQQFTVSGSGLTGDITATAPAGFELSLASGSGYGSSVPIPETSGTVSSTVVYVRSAATAPAGGISGNVTLTSTGAGNQTVAVTGTVNALPNVNAVANQIVNNGAPTTAVNFTGTGNAYTWVNDTPGIGLAASGTGDINSFVAVNTGSSPVVATIMAIPVHAGYAYIANRGSGTVSAINTATNTVASTITVGSNPSGVSVSPDGSKVYVANFASGTVSVISTVTNQIVSTITVQNPYGLALSPDGSILYVGGDGTDSFSMINTTTNAIIGTIITGNAGAGNPYGLVVSPDGTRLYLALEGADNISVFNTITKKIINTFSTGFTPWGLAISPDGSKLYVANSGSFNISVINTSTNSIIATISTGYLSSPIGISLSPDGAFLYVANDGLNNVSVINTATNTVTATIPVGNTPYGISVSPDGSQVYVANWNANNVSVISTVTNTATAIIPVGSTPDSFGNFVSGGTGCTGNPIKFTITINPTLPTITTTTATGTISACTGAASASPNLQQFTVTGSGLTGSITAIAPAGFEVSLAAGSGYGSSVIIPQISGTVSSTVVYVRAAATATIGSISGNVTLTSVGASGQTVAVSGIVNAMAAASLLISASGNNICAGTPVTFTAMPTNGGSSPVYQWLLNGNNAGTNSPIFSSSTVANGDVVSCVMTSSSACAVPATTPGNSITMIVNPDVTPSISITTPQNVICAGTPVTFTARPINGGNTPVYQWFVNGNNAGTNSATFSGSSFADGDQISCIMTSNAGCATPASVTSNSITMGVSPIASPTISIAASQNNICPGTNVTFTAMPTNGGSSPVYQWLLNGNNTGANSPTFASSTLSNGDVVGCRLTSNATCLTAPGATSNSIAMVVNALVVPSVTINISANNVCAGTPVTFTASPTNGGNLPVYQWLLNGSNSGTNSPTFSSSTFANGDVVSCIMTSNLACVTPARIPSNSIVTNIFPLPIVNAGGNKTIVKGSSISLSATTAGDIADITWSPGTGLDNNKILTPRATPVSTTLYTITVQTAAGCTATDSIKVTVFNGITIPNTFTPNGDGVNDKWDIQNLKDYQNCEVRIFDRYGSEVYSSKGYYNAWDGTINGKRLPVGTYYYLINLNDGTRPLSGFVALIR